MTDPPTDRDEEQLRLDENDRRERHWTRWGPYLAERQWGTVREDYSADGDVWSYLPHDHARSRAYRWGEDGLLGICDRQCRVCFALTLWNGKDPILKERLFGLNSVEGNHGEDVKELYYYLDATPTSSYLAGLYKYPQAAFPYDSLVAENRRRGRRDRELELLDTGVFDGDRYFDVRVEYAKAAPEDILIRVHVVNRGPAEATLHLLPTIWLRNTWAWGRTGDGYWPRGRIERVAPDALEIAHPDLERMRLRFEAEGSTPPRFLFTDNETNADRLFGFPSASAHTKDAFHRLLVNGERDAVRQDPFGTKAASWHTQQLPAGGTLTLRLRLTSVDEPASPGGASPGGASPGGAFGAGFEAIFAARQDEAERFYRAHRDPGLTPEERNVVRQADAGLLWSRQSYQYVVAHWLDGDPGQPAPPPSRASGRNADWRHLWARDVLSMPDKWEYPWFASWDLAFHAVAGVRVDPEFSKRQVLALCREWFMHPNGKLPAYEFAFDDVNPPLVAWAAWRIYQLSASPGHRDRQFLERAFQKCLVSFTWWTNRKDVDGNHLFAGGFLGLDNIGLFDRSSPLPGGGHMEQADATAWMAFYATTMMAIALELSRENPAYGDMAPKFFDHFVAIAGAMNRIGGGLWDEEDGFYYDHALIGGEDVAIRIRSMVGLVPLLAAESLDADDLEELPLFRKRLEWVVVNQPQLVREVAVMRKDATHANRLLSIVTRERLVRVLRYMLDEDELLSPFGIRSLSKVYEARPYVLDLGGVRRAVSYAPGDSETDMFGGNSNWRGPVWFPLNYLLIEALKRHHHFYGDTLRVECPVRSGQMLTLLQVAEELERRLGLLFLPDASGRRPCHGGDPRYASDPAFRDLILFHEYFHGDDGRGCGASHQTGWTALAANMLDRVAATRSGSGQ